MHIYIHVYRFTKSTDDFRGATCLIIGCGVAAPFCAAWEKGMVVAVVKYGMETSAQAGLRTRCTLDVLRRR